MYILCVFFMSKLLVKCNASRICTGSTGVRYQQKRYFIVPRKVDEWAEEIRTIACSTCMALPAPGRTRSTLPNSELFFLFLLTRRPKPTKSIDHSIPPQHVITDRQEMRYESITMTYENNLFIKPGIGIVVREGTSFTTLWHDSYEGRPHPMRAGIRPALSPSTRHHPDFPRHWPSPYR